MGGKSSTNRSPGELVGLPSPFGEVGDNISDFELRETAFEILVSECWRNGGESISTQQYQTHSVLMKTLRLPPGKSKSEQPQTVVEVMGIRMGVSKKAYPRIVNALNMIRGRHGQMIHGRQVGQVGQVGQEETHIASVLPLELLQVFTVTDFDKQQQEYEASQRRHLKILEAGLLGHPNFPLEKSYSTLCEARKGKIKTRANSKWMQDVRSAVTSLAYRSSDGTVSNICHWADRYPLNLCLYEKMLDACIDINAKTSIVEEVDEFIELIKKTWVILGVNQMLHNLCFSWVLIHHFVVTDRINNGLLLKADTLLDEVSKDETTMKNLEYSKLLNQLKSILSEAKNKNMGGQT